MAQFDVLGVGNALVDIQTQVDDELVAELGFGKGIMTLVDDAKQGSVLQKLMGRPFHRCAGGSAANTVAAVADFGGTAAYVGKIGNDEVGEFFLQDLRDLGITIDVQPAADAPTGTCAVLITKDAHRTMLTNLGASSILSRDDIVESHIRDAKYIYVEGYLLTGDTTREAAYHAMGLAKKYGTKVAFTASDPFLVDLVRDEIWELVKGPVDLLFCNELEAKSLTGESDPINCAAMIHEHAENVALTLGENGSIVMHGGEAFPIEGVKVDAVDTTGAGDMYAGALMYGITHKMNWRQAGHLASHAAARVVSQMGARLENKFTDIEVQILSKID